MILWSVIFYRHIFCGSQITAVKCGCCNGLGVHKRNGSDLASCRIGAFTVGEGELEDEDFPDGATMEDLEGAIVTDLFLQGDEEAYVEGQAVKNIELVLYDVADPTRKIVFKKDAFKETDLGEYYDITWE